ncbi:hypothetical protein SH449x_004200 [Pirellulaceae bacterium SH449]
MSNRTNLIASILFLIAVPFVSIVYGQDTVLMRYSKASLPEGVDTYDFTMTSMFGDSSGIVSQTDGKIRIVIQVKAIGRETTDNANLEIYCSKGRVLVVDRQMRKATLHSGSYQTLPVFSAAYFKVLPDHGWTYFANRPLSEWLPGGFASPRVHSFSTETDESGYLLLRRHVENEGYLQITYDQSMGVPIACSGIDGRGVSGSLSAKFKWQQIGNGYVLEEFNEWEKVDGKDQTRISLKNFNFRTETPEIQDIELILGSLPVGFIVAERDKNGRIAKSRHIGGLNGKVTSTLLDLGNFVRQHLDSTR